MNGQKVLWTCTAGAKVRAKLDKKIKGYQEKFKAEEQALVALQDEIQKKSSVWSKDKKDEKLMDFSKKRRDMQAKQQDARADIDHLKEKELKPVIEEIQKGLKKYGDEKGYTIILDANGGVVPYFNQAIDVTDDLIKALDKSMAK